MGLEAVALDLLGGQLTLTLPLTLALALSLALRILNPPSSPLVVGRTLTDGLMD